MPSLIFLRFTVSLITTGILPLSFAATSEMAAARPGNRLIFHGGVSGVFDGEKNPTLAFEYRWGASKAGLQPWLGAGWTTDGSTLVGGGLLHTWRIGQRWELVGGFGPGYYDRHEGQDLGNQLEFYSFAEAGWEFSRGRRLLLRFAHISNASTSEINPGTELITVGFGVRLP